MKDSNFINWIADRIVNVYGESEMTDFVISLRNLSYKLKQQEPFPSFKHQFHKCNDEDCNICRGGLALCTVCKCGEGELPTECPGVALDEFVREAIYKGGLDFKDGRWVVEYCQKHGKSIVKGSSGKCFDCYAKKERGNAR